jgi:hypothetical protein
MRSAKGWPLAVLLVSTPVVVLVVLGFIDPALTARLVSEEGPVEWVQAALSAFAAALAFFRARRLGRAGRSPAFDLVVATGLLVLAAGELELDRWIFGTKVIGTRFLLGPRKPVAWPWRVVANLIAVGVPAAVGIYAAVRIRPLIDAGRAAMREPWGWILLAGVAFFGAGQVFERALDSLRFVSPFFFEEVAELAASCCFVAAYVLRPTARARPGAG